MQVWQIVLIAACGALAFIAIVIGIAALSKRKRRYKDKVGKVKVIDGVRYTADENVTEAGGGVKASFTQKDIVLTRGKEYLVQKGGKLMPGKYTVLMSDESVDEANVRIGGFVRPYKHNSSIVLADGDKVSATSQNVLLR